MPEMVRQYPVGVFKLADIEAAGEMVGAPVQGATARSQMANYVNLGFLERVNLGEFRFTKAGLTALGSLSNAPDAEAPAVADVQPAGALRDDAHNVSPKASDAYHSIGGDRPR